MTATGAVTTAAVAPDGRLPAHARLAYGLLGLPFAMAALPVYVHLPKFYSEHLGVPLATLAKTSSMSWRLIEPSASRLCTRAANF